MLKSIKHVSQVPLIKSYGTDGKLYTRQLEFYLITKDLYDMIISEGGGTEPIEPQDIYGINFDNDK